MNLRLFFFVCFLFYSASMHATHFLSGEINYNNSINDSTYIIDFKAIIDCKNGNPNAIDEHIYLGVYHSNSNLLYKSLTLPLQKDTQVTQWYDCTSQLKPDCFRTLVYSDTIVLSKSKYGYRIIHERCCLSQNLNFPEIQGYTIYTTIAPDQEKNRSPQIQLSKNNVLCLGELKIGLDRVDEEGDSLSYEFIVPIAGVSSNNPRPMPGDTLFWPRPNALYYNGYNKSRPFGAGSYAVIKDDSFNFLIKKEGRFYITLEIKEWRNQELTSTSINLYLITATSCFDPPKLSAYELEAVFENAKGAVLNWKICLKDTITYEIFKSLDSVEFKKIAEQEFDIANATRYVDPIAWPETQKVFYRIDTRDKMGKITGSSNVARLIKKSTTHSNKSKWNGLRVYPNPSSELIHVIWEVNKYAIIEIQGLEGEVLFRDEVKNTNSREVSIRKFAPGIYVLKVYWPETHQQASVKLVKQ